ncbi:MAG: DUF4468 domain-containing protein [Bacteroidaceae bacterium]|nr:DUF4468 domain-containing protein [Bacteroidaceae bacterium]
MKKIILAALVLAQTSVVFAQNTWEMTEREKAELTKVTPTIDPIYAPGAVPVVDGNVVFEQTFNAPGKSAKQILDLIKGKMAEWVAEPNQITYEGGARISNIVYDKPEEGIIAARFYEYLVFKRAALVLDRTDFDFTLTATCKDGQATVKMSRMRYVYEKDRAGGFNEPAENIITDEYAFNKKQTKFNRTYGKFRRKTIDRKDYIFNEIEKLLK